MRKTINASRVIHCLGLLAFSFAATHTLLGDSTHTFKRSIGFGIAAVQTSDGCVILHTVLSAGNFFSGLRRKQTPSGVIFINDNTVIETFPQTVTVAVKGMWDPGVSGGCNEATPRRIKNMPALVLMRSLKFDVAWRVDSERREAGGIEVAPKLGGVFSEYLISVPSRGVPLTSRLEVSVLTKDGDPVAEFIASL